MKPCKFCCIFNINSSKFSPSIVCILLLLFVIDAAVTAAVIVVVLSSNLSNHFLVNQVDLLFQLYSNAVQLTSSVSPSPPSNENEPLLPARSVTSTVTGTGRSVRRTASITSSSGFDVIDDESMSSESTPKLSVTSLDTPKVCIKPTEADIAE